MRHTGLLRLRTRLTGALLAVVVLAGSFTSFQIATEVEPAAAADGSSFDPGNIISDAVFYNSGTMTAGAVQTFLASKVKSCLTGYTCLKDYRQNTFDRPADPMCQGYRGAAGETAATIIAKVAQSCSINPQVLLVLLQKEQALITDNWPTDRQYRSATGYGCPDTADCDTAYYGFYNQVYMGAWALKRYGQPAGTGAGTEWNSRFDLMYPVGQTSNIYWNPNAGCGTSPVRIANQATHALYVYTPYRPNSAALAAGYGEGDGCSSYGNRNFFLYFSDWFGSPQGFVVVNAIANRWSAMGAASGALGAPTSNEMCGLKDGGCWQQFRGGRIYWSASSGAWALTNAILSRWVASGSEYSGFGYPTSSEMCGLKDGGCWQQFQNGRIYWSANSGAWPIIGGIGNHWIDSGSEYSGFGYPTSSETCGLKDGGCWQQYQNGRIYWSPNSGSWPITGGIGNHWLESGADTSGFGYPTSREACGLKDGGCWQQYQNGRIYWSPNSGSWPITGAIGARWTSSGADQSRYGFPMSRETCGLKGGGCWQQFQSGRIYWSPSTGAQPIAGAIGNRWIDMGADSASIGYPTVGEICGIKDGGCWQQYQSGRMYWSPSSGAWPISGNIGNRWVSSGSEYGSLGFPTSGVEERTDGTRRQSFQGGALVEQRDGSVRAD